MNKLKICCWALRIMLPAMFYVLSGERSWQCCWNVMLLRYCVQCKKQPRCGCDVAWNIVRMFGYYCVQCTEYCYEPYCAQRCINTACKVTGYFSWKVKVRRNIASNVASYVTCNTTSNIIYKVACYNTYNVTRKKACEVASSTCLLCNIMHKVKCKVISCKWCYR